MVLAFHDNKGLIYTNMVPRGTTVNADYIVGALKQFFKRMRQKRPQMVDEGFILHWDNAPVHTAKVVTKDGVEVLGHPPPPPPPTVLIWHPVIFSCSPR